MNNSSASVHEGKPVGSIGAVPWVDKFNLSIFLVIILLSPVAIFQAPYNGSILEGATRNILEETNEGMRTALILIGFVGSMFSICCCALSFKTTRYIEGTFPLLTFCMTLCVVSIGLVNYPYWAHGVFSADMSWHNVAVPTIAWVPVFEYPVFCMPSFFAGLLLYPLLCVIPTVLLFAAVFHINMNRPFFGITFLSALLVSVVNIFCIPAYIDWFLD